MSFIPREPEERLEKKLVIDLQRTMDRANIRTCAYWERVQTLAGAASQVPDLPIMFETCWANRDAKGNPQGPRKARNAIAQLMIAPERSRLIKKYFKALAEAEALERRTVGREDSPRRLCYVLISPKLTRSHPGEAWVLHSVDELAPAHTWTMHAKGWPIHVTRWTHLLQALVSADWGKIWNSRIRPSQLPPQMLDRCTEWQGRALETIWQAWVHREHHEWRGGKQWVRLTLDELQRLTGHVSRTTLRKNLDALAQAGLIEKQKARHAIRVRPIAPD